LGGAEISRSVEGLATGWPARGKNPRGGGGGKIFRTSRTALGSTQSPVEWVPGPSRG